MADIMEEPDANHLQAPRTPETAELVASQQLGNASGGKRRRRRQQPQLPPPPPPPPGQTAETVTPVVPVDPNRFCVSLVAVASMQVIMAGVKQTDLAGKAAAQPWPQRAYPRTQSRFGWCLFVCLFLFVFCFLSSL